MSADTYTPSTSFNPTDEGYLVKATNQLLSRERMLHADATRVFVGTTADEYVVVFRTNIYPAVTYEGYPLRIYSVYVTNKRVFGRMQLVPGIQIDEELIEMELTDGNDQRISMGFPIFPDEIGYVGDKPLAML